MIRLLLGLALSLSLSSFVSLPVSAGGDEREITTECVSPTDQEYGLVFDIIGEVENVVFTAESIEGETCLWEVIYPQGAEIVYPNRELWVLTQATPEVLGVLMPGHPEGEKLPNTNDLIRARYVPAYQASGEDWILRTCKGDTLVKHEKELLSLPLKFPVVGIECG